MSAGSALVFTRERHLTHVYPDRSAKGLVYLVLSRDNVWLLLGQSLPLLCRFLNNHLSNGQQYDNVSVTSLHDNINRQSGRSGGYCKGKWRVRTVSLDECASEFERQRIDFEHFAVIAANPMAYETHMDESEQ